MTDTDILRKAMARYRNATGSNTTFKDDVIVFLEKEIDQYREKLERMENNVERMAEKNNKLKERINAIYGAQSADAITEQLERWKKAEQRVKIIDEFSESIAAAVQELSEKHDALAGRVDQLFGDTVQTLTTFAEERTSDGGTMTLSRTTAKWKLVAECLLENGYFVTSHFDDENTEDKTITIEFWRA